MPVKLKISPTTLDFGSVKVGNQKGPRNIVVRNPKRSGNRPGTTVLIEGVDGAADPFHVMNNCSALLPAGQQCTIAVTFAPTVAGKFNATLQIDDNAKHAPQSVKLKGRGK